MPNLAIGKMIPQGETEKSYFIMNTSAGSNYRFRVTGETIEAQLETIQKMSTTMVSDPAALMSKLPEYCDIGDVELTAAYNVLFGETTACLLDSTMVFDVVAADEVLAGCLVDLGMALLACP